jgi:methyl-accepting chemotaxis protein
LGKWYYGIGKRTLGDTRAYQELDAPHARFHALVREAVEAVERQNAHKAKATLEELHNVSATVFRLLDSLGASSGTAAGGGNRLRMAA